MSVMQVAGGRHRREAEDLAEDDVVAVEVCDDCVSVDLLEVSHGEAGLGHGGQG